MQVGVVDTVLRHDRRYAKRRHRLSRSFCVLYGVAVTGAVFRDLPIGMAEILLLLAAEFRREADEIHGTCSAPGIGNG